MFPHLKGPLSSERTKAPACGGEATDLTDDMLVWCM